MAVSIKSNADGVSGAIQINGVDVAAFNGTGFTSGVITATSSATLTNTTLSGVIINDGYTEEVYDLTGTVIAATNGSIQTKTLGVATTFTETLANGQSVILGITAGSYAVTWPTITWTKAGGGGTAPTLSSSGKSWVALWKVGTVLYGSYLGDTSA